MSEPGLVSLKAGEAVFWVSWKNQDCRGGLKEGRGRESVKQGIGDTGEGKEGREDGKKKGRARENRLPPDPSLPRGLHGNTLGGWKAHPFHGLPPWAPRAIVPPLAPGWSSLFI